MTIAQYTICRREMEFVTSRKDFISRFPGVDPGELVDVWAILHLPVYTFASIREFSGLTQMEVSERYSMPKSTIEGWSAHNGKRQMVNYLLDLFAVDIINERNNPAVDPVYII